MTGSTRISGDSGRARREPGELFTWRRSVLPARPGHHALVSGLDRVVLAEEIPLLSAMRGRVNVFFNALFSP
jgi:hypothetical protein